MGKRSKKKSNSKSKSKKLKSKFAEKLRNHTLTRQELERFSYDDKVQYLGEIISSQHPEPRIVDGEPAQIGGWYQCIHCAMSSVFGDGYVSEDEPDIY